MGMHADLARKYFAGPLGLEPWDVGDTDANGRPVFTKLGMQDATMRNVVLGIADHLCADYFWTRSAARASNRHPDVCHGDGGLVRHTWLACYWAVEFMRLMDEYPEGATPAAPIVVTKHHDSVLGALILHDMMKRGDPAKANLPARTGRTADGVIAGCHGVDLAEAIVTQILRGSKPQPKVKHMIMAIAGHMGPWTLPAKWRPDRIQDPETRLVAQIVSTADYAASRRCDRTIQLLYDTRLAVPQATGQENSDRVKEGSRPKNT